MARGTNRQRELLALHAKLLGGDVVAWAELCALTFASVLERTTHRFPDEADADLLSDGVTEALTNYRDRPGLYDPGKGEIQTFLAWQAAGCVSHRQRRRTALRVHENACSEAALEAFGQTHCQNNDSEDRPYADADEELDQLAASLSWPDQTFLKMELDGFSDNDLFSQLLPSFEYSRDPAARKRVLKGHHDRIHQALRRWTRKLVSVHVQAERALIAPQLNWKWGPFAAAYDRLFPFFYDPIQFFNLRVNGWRDFHDQASDTRLRVSRGLCSIVGFKALLRVALDLKSRKQGLARQSDPVSEGVLYKAGPLDLYACTYSLPNTGPLAFPHSGDPWSLAFVLSDSSSEPLLARIFTDGMPPDSILPESVEDFVGLFDELAIVDLDSRAPADRRTVPVVLIAKPESWKLLRPGRLL